MLRDTKAQMQNASGARRNVAVALIFLSGMIIAGIRPAEVSQAVASDPIETPEASNVAPKIADVNTGDNRPDVKRALDAMKRVDAVDIAGLVIDESGNPVRDVAVDAWHWYPGNETTTDEKGFFQLDNPGEEGHTKVELLFTKEGFSPVYVLQQPTGRPDFIVTLPTKPYFEGVVTNPKGQPVENALIRASFGPVEIDGGVMDDVVTTTRSGADGRYLLRVAPNSYDIQVSAADAGVWRKSDIVIATDETKSLPIRLEEGVRFEARVVDSETREPVEGVVLFRWQAPHLVARSNAEGVIKIDNLNPGEIEFNCGAGEEKSPFPGAVYYAHGPLGRWWSPQAIHEWGRYQIISPTLGWQRNFDDLSFDLQVGMEPVEIIVEQGVTVSGVVTDPDGNPVEKATVAPALTGTGNSLTGDTRYSVETDSDGRYSVVLPASNDATYNLIVHDGGYEEWRNWANGVSPPMKTSAGEVLENFDLALTRPAVVKGRVTKDGAPVADMRVRTQAFDQTENRYYDPTIRTQKDGTFELNFVRPGKHHLQVEPFGVAPGRSVVIDVAAGQTLEGVELVAP